LAHVTTTNRSADQSQERTSTPPTVARNLSRRVRRPASATERETMAQILRLVRSERAATRQELERVSGLGRAIVADRIATLKDRNLIVEEGLGPSTGGRMPRQVRFNATAGYVLVCTLGTTTLGVALSDLSGELLFEHHESTDAAVGAEKTLERVGELFDWILEEHPGAREAWAITVGVPGFVSSPGGRLGEIGAIRHMPGWADYPVHHELSKRFNAPVLIANEVHLMALGELRRGQGSSGDDLIFLKVGTGIGAGLCTGGRIHRGAVGFAGDIGHVAVATEGAMVCRCGNRGCLEAEAGGAAIAREGQAAAVSGRSPILASIAEGGTVITAAHVGLAASRGDAVSVELITRSGRLVGETLATLVAGLNPSIVVVGGGVAQAGSVFVGAVRDGMHRRSRALAVANLPLMRSELGKTAGLVGGALAALEDLFTTSYLRRWIEHGSPRIIGPARAAPPTSKRLSRANTTSSTRRPAARRTEPTTATLNRPSRTV